MSAPRLSRRATASVTGLVVGTAAYLLTLLNYGSDLTRTANPLGYASNFFDFQARAFMEGRLDVPPGSLGIEAFQRDGLEYMYFGPFPSLLRIPVFLVTDELDGRLTLVSMALAFVVMATMATRLVWLVRDTMRDGESVGRFEAAALGMVIALVTGGTTMTYVAALPWVYHEVYSWAIALAIGAMYWMLRILLEPTYRSIGWLGVFGAALVLTRTTGGWAICITTVGVAVWLLAGRLHKVSRGQWIAAFAAGAIPLAIGIIYNYVRFDHAFMFPLEDQVWTQVNEHRRTALAANGGAITGPQFFPTAFMAYFRIDGIRFVDYFPWITLPAEPARSYGGAIVDQTYRTGSVTTFMPLLLLLTAIAVVTAFRPGAPRAPRMLRLPLAAGILIPGGVMAYGYFSHRYTSEFVPALVLGGIVGAVTCVRWLERRSSGLRAGAIIIATVGTCFSIAANMLIGASAAANTAGGDSLRRFLEVQASLSPTGQARLVTQSTNLPTGGTTDQLHIVGDCESLWLNTGDRYDQWILVERRSLVFSVHVPPDTPPGNVKLAEIDTDDPSIIGLEIAEGPRGRVYVRDSAGLHHGNWFTILPPYTVTVGIRDLAGLGYAEVSSTPGGWSSFVRSHEWGERWVTRPIAIRPATNGRTAEGSIRVSQIDGLPLKLCNQILDRVER